MLASTILGSVLLSRVLQIRLPKMRVLTCGFIPLDQRLKLLRDMLGLKEEEMDPLEQYNLAQFLAEL